MKEPINFLKRRELGDILNDTFKFIRNEFKPLFGLIFKTAGLALLIMVVAYVFYARSVGDIADFRTNSDLALLGMALSGLIMLIAAVAFYSLLYGTILHYIKSYIKHNGVVVKEEVAEGIKRNFWSLIGLSILVGLMSGVGFVFCIAPGVYLATVLATTYAIHIFEKRSVSDSISYSFDLIKGEWWITFATLLVMFIIYYIVIIIVQVPQYVYLFAKDFTMAEQLSGDPSMMIDWGYIILTALGLIVQYLMQILIVITTVFVYFNLNEKKNFTGTMETIESIGNREE
ncbi:MAG: hypothetical protein AAF489_06375 [Bacteroidota bacterium]